MTRKKLTKRNVEALAAEIVEQALDKADVVAKQLEEAGSPLLLHLWEHLVQQVVWQTGRDDTWVHVPFRKPRPKVRRKVIA